MGLDDNTIFYCTVHSSGAALSEHQTSPDAERVGDETHESSWQGENMCVLSAQ